jgi:hypothetical protein
MIVHGYRPTPNALVLSRSGPMRERCMKDTVHPSVHPSVHQHTCLSVQTRRLSTSNSTQFGHGQNTVLGWFEYRLRSQRTPATSPAKLPGSKTLKSGGSDTGFSTFSRPKSSRGHSRPMFVCGARVLSATARTLPAAAACRNRCLP